MKELSKVMVEDVVMNEYYVFISLLYFMKTEEYQRDHLQSCAPSAPTLLHLGIEQNRDGVGRQCIVNNRSQLIFVPFLFTIKNAV